MRGISFGLVVIALTLGAAFGDPPGKEQPFSVPLKPGAGQLDELLAKAVANSPDVQIAEAKLREAEAELRRSRMSLFQKIIDLQAAAEMQKQQVLFAEAALAKATKLRQSGTLSEEEFRVAMKQLADAKANTARVETQLAMLCGQGPEVRAVQGIHLGAGGAIGFTGAATTDGEGDGRLVRPPSPAMAEKIRKALDTPVRAGDFKETPLADVLNYYRELSKTVPIVIAIGGHRDDQISLTLDKELPLGSHLQALQDLAPGLLISVRDYGVLVTFDGQPDDAISFLDFWQGKPKREAPK